MPKKTILELLLVSCFTIRGALTVIQGVLVI